MFHRRDTLLGLFWPELDEAHARSALSQAIRFLRRELGSTAALENRGAEEVGVNRSLLWCDAATFLDDVEAARYGEALERYRGDFLLGFFIDCGPDFDHWIETTRAQFRSGAATAARRFAEAREQDEHYTTAVASARRAVDLSGADERVVCELLDLLDRLGTGPAPCTPTRSSRAGSPTSMESSRRLRRRPSSIEFEVVMH
jgi:DNA-binding SARP family transcriptional activator